MEHLDTEAIAVIAACLLGWALVSAKFGHWSITSPIALVAIGALVGADGLGLVDLGLKSSELRALAEITLALVLFADASRVNVHELRRDARLPGRLLLIGLPLTVLAGIGLAVLLLPSNDIWIAALIAAAIAPTDAALGAPIMEDRRIPERIRRVLNVESGLNDGLITPVVTFLIAGAAASEEVQRASVSTALRQLGVGLLVGLAVGVLGGYLIRVAVRHGWSEGTLRRIAVLSLALLAYASAIEAGGNGFVAAFVAGMAFGTAAPHEQGLVRFTSSLGELLSLLVWFLFGAVILIPVLQSITWETVVFAVLALTVARMIPVALALLGVGLDQGTVALIGWFGPRGLASIVFALLALDSLPDESGHQVLAAITVTVLLSVIAHGLTTGPLARLYTDYTSKRLEPSSPEHASTAPLAVRSLAGVEAPHEHRVETPAP